jgi:hypothetical protein
VCRGEQPFYLIHHLMKQHVKTLDECSHLNTS